VTLTALQAPTASLEVLCALIAKLAGMQVWVLVVASFVWLDNTAVRKLGRAPLVTLATILAQDRRHALSVRLALTLVQEPAAAACVSEEPTVKLALVSAVLATEVRSAELERVHVENARLESIARQTRSSAPLVNRASLAE
jgi:hypothetical protein